MKNIIITNSEFLETIEFDLDEKISFSNCSSI